MEGIHMPKKFFAIAAFAVVIIAVAGWLSCGKKPPVATAITGTISGAATDSANGNAVAGGTVITTVPATSSVTANTAGYFTITGVNPGTYAVTASKTGYINKSVSVAVSAGNTTTANIALVACMSSL